MKIEEVFGRQGHISEEAMLSRKRIISAVLAMNGDIKKAHVNILENTKFDYSEGTVRVYYSEYQRLSEPEKKRFSRLTAHEIAKAVNYFIDMPIESEYAISQTVETTEQENR